MKILIYLQNGNSKIVDVSLQLISKTKEMTANYDNVEIIGLFIAQENCDMQILKNCGLDKLIFAKTINLKNYSTREYAKIFCETVEKEQPDIVFIGATNEGRDLAPRVATTLKTGLTADCTQLEITDEAKLVATRPTFGGSLMAQILCKTKPQMATVRPNVFKQKEFNQDNELQIETVEFDYSSDLEIVKCEEKTDEVCDYSTADVILAGGMGLKNKENFDLLFKLADKIGAKVGAKVGATRKAVEKNLVDKKYQIGQTGQTVAPKIYFAIGISGAIQHVSGIENSDIIVAINPDKNAPIHTIADYSIYDDGQKFITEWLNN